MEPCLLLGLIVPAALAGSGIGTLAFLPGCRGDHRASPSRHLLMYLLLDYTLSRHPERK